MDTTRTGSASAKNASVKSAPMSSKKFKVTLKRSLIGCTETQRNTVRCLGLRHRHQTVVIADNPAMRGQIMKVQHMVDVQVEK